MYDNLKEFLDDTAHIDTTDGLIEEDLVFIDKLLTQAEKLEKEDKEWQSLSPRGQQFLLTILRVLRQAKAHGLSLEWAAPEDICVLTLLLEMIDLG